MSPRLEIFDPALCCSTGVCGPTSDPALARVAADLEWVRARGVQVERHGLAQDPQAYVAHTAVRAALEREGVGCLPLVLLDGRILSQGRYPERAALAAALGLEGESDAPAPTEGGSSCCAPRPGEAKPRVPKGRCC